MPAGNWDSGDRGIAADPNRITEFEDGVGLALEFANVIKPKNLTCLVGKIPSSVSDKEAQDTLIKNLSFAAEKLSNSGFQLLVEPINTVDIPGYWLSRTDKAVEIINLVGHSNIKLQYDIYHMQIMEGNIINSIKNNLGIIGHMQLADNPGRHEPGTGELNYLRALCAIIYFNYYFNFWIFIYKF